jgi:ABC-type cobalamin/Fe3+-siderophores transport system ATPase subunit
MDELPLDSLEIRQFRAFHHLQIESLRRVNLIVGNNNMGKSCLLEALWLYARRGDPAVVWKLLEGRDEIGHPAALGAMVAERTHGIKHLFYGRHEIDELPEREPIQIGSIQQPAHRLEVGIGWYCAQDTPEGERRIEFLSPGEVDNVRNPTQRLRVRFGEGDWAPFLFSADLFHHAPRLVENSIHCVYISGEAIDREQVGKLWDAVAHTAQEQDVLDALRVIMPSVETVRIPSDHEGRVRPGGHLPQRIPCIKLEGSDQPVPVLSLGKGMTRMLGISLALLNAQHGFLLIDDFGSGLHYAVQVKLWQRVFQMAQQAHIQVFATAHTWDCVEAFRQAATGDLREQGMLVCLKRNEDDGGIVAQQMTGEDLATVTRANLDCADG